MTSSSTDKSTGKNSARSISCPSCGLTEAAFCTLLLGATGVLTLIQSYRGCCFATTLTGTFFRLRSIGPSCRPPKVSPLDHTSTSSALFESDWIRPYVHAWCFPSHEWKIMNFQPLFGTITWTSGSVPVRPTGNGLRIVEGRSWHFLQGLKSDVRDSKAKHDSAQKC